MQVDRLGTLWSLSMQYIGWSSSDLNPMDEYDTDFIAPAANG